MAVKAESFLVLDTSLAGRISRAWIRAVQPKLDEIIELAEEGNFAEARSQASALDMSGVAARNKKFIELASMSAILFGASDITPPEMSELASKRPEVLDKATDNFIAFIEDGLIEAVRKELHKAITAEEENQLEERDSAAKTQIVQKASRIRELVGNTNLGPKALMKDRAMIGASLHTSRLSQWGFLVEADAKGIVQYQVNEELDNRTCPVCQTMHGSVFTVQEALQRVERLVTVDDPDELKSMAPFPKQTPDAVEELQNLPTEELQARGLDTPPYHPLCRGRVVQTSDPTVQIGEPSSTQVSGPTQRPEQQANPLAVYREIEDDMRLDMTDQQRIALSNYARDTEGDLNNMLRSGGRMDATLAAEARELDKLFSKKGGKTPRNLTTYRGVESLSDTLGNPKVGDIIRDKAFLSTSVGREEAMEFASQAFVPRDPAMLEIFVGKGKKALHFGNIDFDDELELLLSRGAKLRVREVVEEGITVSGRKTTVKGKLIKAELL